MPVRPAPTAKPPTPKKAPAKKPNANAKTAKSAPIQKTARKPAAPTPRTRLELDERRAQLIALGFDLFANHPYDEVHIESVAKAAGISKGLLYHYFPTKRDFYTATLRVAASQLLEEIEPDNSLLPLERLATGLTHYLQFVERYATAYVALMRGGVGVDSQVATLIEETRSAVFSRLMLGLTTVSADNSTQPLLPPLGTLPLLRTALRGFIGFVEATSLDWVVSRDVPREKLVALLVQVLLHTVQTVGTGTLGQG